MQYPNSPAQLLDTAKLNKNDNRNQILSRFPYNGKKTILFHVLLQHERSYEFRSQDICIPCDDQSKSMEEDRELCRARPPWDPISLPESHQILHHGANTDSGDG